MSMLHPALDGAVLDFPTVHCTDTVPGRKHLILGCLGHCFLTRKKPFSQELVAALLEARLIAYEFLRPQEQRWPVQDTDSLSTMSSERLPGEQPFQNWVFSPRAASEKVQFTCPGLLKAISLLQGETDPLK